MHSIGSPQNLELETELARVSLSAYSEHNAEGSPNLADIQLPAKAVFSKVIKCKKIKPESDQNYFFFFFNLFSQGKYWCPCQFSAPYDVWFKQQAGNKFSPQKCKWKPDQTFNIDC